MSSLLVVNGVRSLPPSTWNQVQGCINKRLFQGQREIGVVSSVHPPEDSGDWVFVVKLAGSGKFYRMRDPLRFGWVCS